MVEEVNPLATLINLLVKLNILGWNKHEIATRSPAPYPWVSGSDDLHKSATINALLPILTIGGNGVHAAYFMASSLRKRADRVRANCVGSVLLPAGQGANRSFVRAFFAFSNKQND